MYEHDHIVKTKTLQSAISMDRYNTGAQPGRWGLFLQSKANEKVLTLFQQPKRWLNTWALPDGQYQNQTDYVLCGRRWSSVIQTAKTRPGAVAQIMSFFLQNSSLKKVGKTMNHPGMTKSNLWLYSGGDE